MYKPSDADVIVVGGGIAGLTAAYCLYLKEPTLDIIVLESSDRIGGRAFSVPLLVDDGKRVSYFDLGAQWISKEQNQLFELLEKLGIQSHTTHKQGKIITHYLHTYKCHKHVKGHFSYLNGSEQFQYAKFIIKVEVLCRKLKAPYNSKYVKELSQITLEEFINETVSSDAVHAIIDHMVFCSCGVRPYQVSALFYIFFCVSTRGICHQLPTEEDTLHDVRIKGGAQAICDKIAREIGRDSIVTDEHVKSVDFGSKFVEIVSKHTTYRCRTIIIAVPPKDILSIKFSPTLSDKHLNAIRKTCTNTVTNFVITFEREFWKRLQLSGECYFFDKNTSKGPIDYCTNISTPDTVALAGRIFQGKVTTEKFPIYRSEVLTQLAHYFGEEALYPVDYCEKSWTNHSCQMVGWEVGNEDYINEISECYDKMFWAGAETTPEWYGYLAGAVHSGKKAALQVLYVLRPALLNLSDMSIISPSRRTQFAPLRRLYGESVYTVIEHWKLITSVCFMVLVALWRLKRAFYLL